MALALAAQPVLGQSVDCMSNKVTITSTPEGAISARTEEHLTFLINDQARTIAFADGRPLQVNRFEQSWISADDNSSIAVTTRSATRDQELEAALRQLLSVQADVKSYRQELRDRAAESKRRAPLTPARNS